MYIISLALGFAAWGFAAGALLSKKSRPGLSAVSWALCSLSLASQIFVTNYLVSIPNLATIEDTYPGIAFGAAVLLIVNTVLNLAAGLRKR